MVHLDLAAERIAHFPNCIVGNISTIPTPDASFDVVLCVGSVLNYDVICVQGRAMTCRDSRIREQRRTGRCEGKIILQHPWFNAAPRGGHSAFHWQRKWL